MLRKMTGKKRKAVGVGRAAGIALVVMFCRLTPCWGMDAMTQAEMGDTCGRSGITVVFGNTFTMSNSFTSLNQGDGDGWGAIGGVNDNPGWLVLMGNGTNRGEITVSLPQGTVMKISAASTGSCTYTPPSETVVVDTAYSTPKTRTASYGGLKVPMNTPFFTFSLSDTNIVLTTPTTIWINLSENRGTRSGTEAWLDSAGLMRATNVTVDKYNMESTLYVWAHP